MAVAQKNKEVKDTHGTVYELTSKLGQGGQGQYSLPSTDS